MTALKLYRSGLGCDAILVLLGMLVAAFGELSGALFITALVHSVVASLVYFRGQRRGGYTRMDQGFFVCGQLGILLCLLLLYLLLAQHYFHPLL
jgi:hypothetical protein